MAVTKSMDDRINEAVKEHGIDGVFDSMDERSVCLDGWFTADQLLVIAKAMKEDAC